MRKIKAIIAALTPKQKRWIALGFGVGLGEGTIHLAAFGVITPDQAKNVARFILPFLGF